MGYHDPLLAYVFLEIIQDDPRYFSKFKIPALISLDHFTSSNRNDSITIKSPGYTHQSIRVLFYDDLFFVKSTDVIESVSA